MIKLKIKVIPGASKSCICGWLGDALKIKVAAPPEKGKANTAVTSIVCQALGLPAGAVQVAAGKTSPHKILDISGLTEAEIKSRLAHYLGEL